MSNFVSIISTAISALATVAIAFLAYYSNKLSKKSYALAQEIKRSNDRIQEREDNFKQEVTDLYKAIVISNLFIGRSNGEVVKDTIEHFNKMYDGKTPIFKESK